MDTVNSTGLNKTMSSTVGTTGLSFLLEAFNQQLCPCSTTTGGLITCWVPTLGKQKRRINANIVFFLLLSSQH